VPGVGGGVGCISSGGEVDHGELSGGARREEQELLSLLLLRRLGGAVAAALRVGVWLASSLADLRYWRAGISCWLQTLRTEGHWIRLGWVGSGWVGSGWVGGFPIHFDSPSCLYTSVTGRQCQLSDGTPTVARTTTRPSMIRQRFSRRV